MNETSYRTILRSSSMVGGAQAINVVANLVKIKLVAILLGAAGVGLAGLYGSLMQTASTIAALGFGTIGTRQIAAAHGADDVLAVWRTRRALFWGTTILALLGAAAFWFMRHWIADVALDDPDRADEIGWLALGVGLTVAAGSQSALLTGLRRIGDLARLQVGAGVAGAILGVVAIWHWGEQGVIAMVLIAPAVLFVLGHFYVARLASPGGARLGWGSLTTEFGILAKLGFAVMVSALAGILAQVVVRILVQRELGTDALGHFQAASTISITYLGFVLGAMAADYFPRLSAAIGEPGVAIRLVNEQTEVALLLCGPLLIGLLGVAPWAISLLYSNEFQPAVEILRWHLLADILKVMSWPLGFVLLASGAARAYFFAELLAAAVFVGGVAIGVPIWGVAATGIAFMGLYIVYLPLVFWLARRRLARFGWSLPVIMQGTGLMVAGLIVVGGSHWSELAGALAGIVLGALAGLWSLMRISQMAVLGGRLAMLGKLGERVTGWTKRRF
ncbi:MAG: O-antigen translocase [Erythrobacter sp.]|nr:O-antigen translocase [Erythrobacter sp.]